MRSPDLVLLLTHSGDYYTIDLVEAALRARGAAPLRVDSDRFPAAWTLAVELSGDEVRLSMTYGEHRIDLSQQVRAVWARRLWPGKTLPGLEPRFAASCAREARTAFFDAFALLDHARWVNPLAAGLAAESKPRQLQIAAEEGLLIPATVIGNDPERVRALFAHTEGKMVTKLLGALSQTMDASGDFVYTSRVNAEHMAAIEEVRLSPQIFQRLIPKQYELRAIFVGEQTFVGAIDASGVEHARTDWRQLTTGDGVGWQAATLPAEVEAATRRLMKRLGLRYGAVDFIVDADGQHVFLEINQAGEWGWLERDLGFPIAAALADTLLDDAVTPEDEP